MFLRMIVCIRPLRARRNGPPPDHGSLEAGAVESRRRETRPKPQIRRTAGFWNPRDIADTVVLTGALPETPRAGREIR